MKNTNLCMNNPITGIWNFITNNILIFICSIFYYLLSVLLFGADKTSFFMVTIIYIISLSIAFSPLGEFLLQIINKARPIETLKEREYIMPLLQEVCEEVRSKYHFYSNIEVHLIDSMTVNAMAIGRHTIAITKGALQTFSEEELKAVMAHEIAHIVYKNTLADLYTIIGNGIFTCMILIFNAVITIMNYINQIFNSSNNVFTLVITVIQLLFKGIVFVIVFSMQVMLMLNKRKSEHKADKFAYDLGYGKEMIEVLYLLDRFSLGDNSTIIQKLTASHPRITKRIKYLESLDEQCEYLYS